MPKCTTVVLLSGGLDSLLVALLADSERQKKWRDKPNEPLTVLSVDYGQADAELYAAARLAHRYGWRQVRAKVTPFPKSLDPAATNLIQGRNAIFLSLAAAMLPGEGTIHIGSNADDQADYPDCRAAFFRAFEAMQQRQGQNGLWCQLVNYIHSQQAFTLRPDWLFVIFPARDLRRRRS